MNEEIFLKACDIKNQIRSLTKRENDYALEIESMIGQLANGAERIIFGHTNYPTENRELDEVRKGKIRQILLDWMSEIDERKSDLEKQFEQL